MINATDITYTPDQDAQSRCALSHVSGQLSIPGFDAHPHEHLWSYWRDSLHRGVADALHYRNARGTTGWGMAVGAITFARLLFCAGQMSRAEFRRHCRLSRRLHRMEREYWASRHNTSVTGAQPKASDAGPGSHAHSV